jgi:hypothetical protein
VVAADAALRRRWVSASALAEALADTRHRRGAAVGRRALTFADGRSESAGESVTRVVFHQLRLPPPQLQVRIYSPNGTFLGRVDSATRNSGCCSSSTDWSSTASLFGPARTPPTSSSPRNSAKSEFATWGMSSFDLSSRNSRTRQQCSSRSTPAWIVVERSSRTAESWAPGLWIPPNRYPGDRCIGMWAANPGQQTPRSAIQVSHPDNARHVGTTTGALSSHTTRCLVTRGVVQMTRKQQGPARDESRAGSEVVHSRPQPAGDYLMILVTEPAPTVRPPSRMAKRRPSSMAIGWISVTVISVVSPGMTISLPSGS